MVSATSDLAELYKQQRRVPIEHYVLINPTLEVADEAQDSWFESCLSVFGYTAIVPRYRRIRVRALGVDGASIQLEAAGWHARTIQHELDHLQGKLLVDRMLSRSFMTKESFQKYWRGKLIAEVGAALGIE